MRALFVLLVTVVTTALGTTASETPGGFGHPTGWVAVKRGKKVHVNPENHAIQIKSRAERGSFRAIVVDFRYSEHISTHGRVIVFMGYTELFLISKCSGSSLKPFPVVPPTAAERTWTVAKSSSSLTISCNGVLLVEQRFDDAVACEVEWGVRMDHISFPSIDTASEFYYQNEEGYNTAAYHTSKFITTELQ